MSVANTPIEPTFVYIVGRGHSGSTMLELLLNRSENIAAMGEIDMLALQIYRDHRTRWVGTCSCEERPQECERWGPVLEKLKQNHGADLVSKPFSWRISDVGLEEEFGVRAPAHWVWYKFHRLVRTLSYRFHSVFSKPFDKTYHTWIKNRDMVARYYAEQAGVNAVVDASKDPLQMRDILQWSSLPVKVIFLTRDVRGLAWSALRKKRLTVPQAASEWEKLNGRIVKLLKNVDTSAWCQVSYEALCENPDRELDRIHDFLGIERVSLTPDQERKKRHTIAGNRTRFRDLDEIREDKAWQDNLTAADLDQIKQIAGPVAEQLGYQL